MSGPVGSQQWMYSSGGFYPHEIGNSARLDSNSYYTRTPSSTSNRKTWTWSGWLKISSLDGYHTPFAFGDNSTGGTDVGTFFRLTEDKLEFSEAHGGSNSFALITNQLFRDPSAWYHFVFSVDTTQSTSSNRIKIYVNGHQITSFSTETYPSQNFDTSANQSGLPQRIGMLDGDAGVFNQYYDGYITEINFIDGSALDASYFGETKADTWIPKKYTGSYGTNGYYLDFATRATDPIDASGNGNNWSSTNVASTDWMLDSPTNNFATLNPLAQFGSPPISEGNLKVELADGSDGVFASIQPTGEKYYWEALLSSGVQGYGVMANSGNASSTINTLYYTDGRIYVANSLVTSSATTATSGDIIGIEHDPAAETIKFFKNNTQIGSTYDATGAGLLPFTGGTGAGSGVSILNFGQDSSFAGNKTAQGNTDANGRGDFYYSPPSGFLALCSANLPNPVAAIDPNQDANPSNYFNTILYTGTGSQHSVTGVGFQPDWLWIKRRNGSADHQTVNAVRGHNQTLEFNNVADELDSNSRVRSFDSDGFTLGGRFEVNDNNDTYVAWSWKLDGAGSANSDGTITTLSTSANQDLGISLIDYRADGNSSATVGTGLDSSRPIDMAIVKQRNGDSEYQVGHRFSGQGSNFAYHSEFNHTTVLSGSAPYFMGTQSATDGSLLYLSSGATSTETDKFLCWVFQSVEGFSKFGSYTGNGDADGPFVYTGFRPAFLIIKNVDSADQWFLNDNKRDPYNVVDEQLLVNSSSGASTSRGIDFLSNGFKIQDGSTTPNGDGNTLIYMAFAEMPFKYANAR